MVIPQNFLDQMIEHAREGVPQEICGMIARDSNGSLRRLYRITNSEYSARFYRMDPQEQFDAMRDIDDRNWDVGVIYHSHPATEPRPSKTDIELAQWPGTFFVIVSLREPERPEVRAWSIEKGLVTEEQIEAA